MDFFFLGIPILWLEDRGARHIIPLFAEVIETRVYFISTSLPNANKRSGLNYICFYYKGR